MGRGRWPLTVLVLFAAVACVDPPPQNTPAGRAALAARLARVAAEHGRFDRVLDEGADLARDVSIPALELELGRSVTDQERRRLREILRRVLTEFVSSDDWQRVVAGVYAEQFTAEDLGALLRFFDSPLGHKLIEMDATLKERVEAGTDALFDEHVEGFIRRADEEIGITFGVGMGS